MADKEARVVCILAMGSSRYHTDWNCKEIWALNNGYKQVAEMKGHCEKIFLAHTQVKRIDTGEDVFNWDELNSLADVGIEIINTHKVKGLKAKLFPMKRITEKFFTDRSYYSDTLAYMVAYALDECTTGKYKDGTLKLTTPLTIKMYGADMMDFDEYGLEKGGIEFWIGYAMGLGVKVEITTWEQGCNLLRTHNGQSYGAKINYKAMGIKLIKKKGHTEVQYVAT